MKKIETIWHHILQNAVSERAFKHTQKAIAEKFGYSVSTVHHALRIPSEIGAVRKSGKFFVLQDFTKLLYYWASVRSLKRDTLIVLQCDESMRELEGRALPNSIFGGYAAATHHLVEPPADYSKTIFYIKEKEISNFEHRFAGKKDKNGNVIALKMPDALSGARPYTSLPWTFVDLWNMHDWYARDFCKALEEKMHEIISSPK